jgi:hypothetical protein
MKHGPQQRTAQSSPLLLQRPAGAVPNPTLLGVPLFASRRAESTNNSSNRLLFLVFRFLASTP